MLNIFRTFLSAAILIYSSSILACPSVPFEALDADGDAVANIRGGAILDEGWKESPYKAGTFAKYNAALFTKADSKKLLRLEGKEPNVQPGVVWAVEEKGGIVPTYVSVYQIKTNLRATGNQVSLSKDADGNWLVGCR